MCLLSVAHLNLLKFCIYLDHSFLLQLVLESLKARQLQETLWLEKQAMEKEMQQANASLDLYGERAARIEEQVDS